jgi:amidase
MRGAGALRAVGIGGFVARLAETLGRPVTADDVEPINWALAEQAREFTAVEYAQALEGRTQVRRAVHQWWADGFDLLLTPTVGHPPARIGEFTGDADDLRDLSMRSGRAVTFTQMFNQTGQPAISLPLHWSAGGLPIGVQLVGAYGREDVLLRVAHQLEQAKPWAGRHPGAAA